MSNSNNYVYRYLKSSHVKNNMQWSDVDHMVEVDQASSTDFINENTFELNPGEKDVSFFRSHQSSDANRILDVLNELHHRQDSGGFSVNSGMLRIDFEVAHEDLNDVRETIQFTDNDKSNRKCRHYGLYILARTSMERLETVNALIELADFYALKQKSKSPETRDILAFRSGGEFFRIAKDVPFPVARPRPKT